MNGIFLPTVNRASDPDYINQYISWLVRHFDFCVCYHSQCSGTEQSADVFIKMQILSLSLSF